MYLTTEPISPDWQTRSGPDAACGAAVFFTGIVRNHNHGRPVTKIYYECYESMAEKKIAEIVARARRQPDIQAVRVLHRTGLLTVGETAVAIAVYAPHRRQAFEVCERVLEEIKSQVPIWKREYFADGTDDWSLAGCCRKELQS